MQLSYDSLRDENYSQSSMSAHIKKQYVCTNTRPPILTMCVRVCASTDTYNVRTSMRVYRYLHCTYEYARLPILTMYVRLCASTDTYNVRTSMRVYRYLQCTCEYARLPIRTMYVRVCASTDTYRVRMLPYILRHHRIVYYFVIIFLSAIKTCIHILTTHEIL